MNIKEENAAELGHLINQLPVNQLDRKALSEFLNLDGEESISAYNSKLTKFKKHLETVANSEEFLNALKPLPTIVAGSDGTWERHYPIQLTPKTHLVHAKYARIPPPSIFMSGRTDPHREKPLPLIFYRPINLMGFTEDKIEGLTKIYTIIQPFGYDFPDLVESDGMKFRLIELFNPHYVCLSRKDSKYKGFPTPIIVDGIVQNLMSNEEYTTRYKHFVRGLGKTIRWSA